MGPTYGTGFFQLVVQKDSRMQGIFNSKFPPKSARVREFSSLFFDNQPENSCILGCAPIARNVRAKPLKDLEQTSPPPPGQLSSWFISTLTKIEH